jgi:hypothetical protein
MDKISRHSYSREERQKILDKTGCKCAHCGKPLDTHSMTVEHIFPVSKGGTDDEFNLVALCQHCNYNKGNSIYRINEYYKYILPEFYSDFALHNMNKAKDFKRNRLLDYDATTYSFIPIKQKLMIENMFNRGTKINKIKQFADRVSVNIIMDKAYEGDAEEILNLINRFNKKGFTTFNKELYTNVYAIRNDINCGEAYTLRINNQVCGAIIFKKIEPEDVDIMQLDIIRDNTRLDKKYIMTLACFSELICEIIPDVMESMFYTMLKNDAIPMYFNILENMYSAEDQVITMPYNIDGVDGNIEFMHLKGIREKLKERINVVYSYNYEPLFSEEDVSCIVEYMLTEDDEGYTEKMNKLFEKAKNESASCIA